VSTVAPFPWATIEAVSRADEATAASLRRFARAHVKLEAVAAALSELSGERVEILVRRTRRLDASRGADDSSGVMLAPADDARSPTKRALIELEGALAAQLVARALRQAAPRVTDPARPASPAIAGAVAAVLAAVLRRAHAGTALRVVAAGPGHALARDLAAGAPASTTTSLTVVLGADAFEARVSVPEAAFVATPEPASLIAALSLLGDAPIALPLVVATTLASRSELASLARGDAFLPTGMGLARPGAPGATAASRDGALSGKVSLVAPRGERGLGADLAPDGRLVVRGLEPHPWDAPMPEPDRSSAATVLEDAPVVVRVELGSVELTARQWAELGPGDVLTLARKLGDPAILRVGGVEVARGELVSVDGEYAVRIAARETR
jgi:flagellar motor switch protein FliN/FliY